MSNQNTDSISNVSLGDLPAGFLASVLEELPIKARKRLLAPYTKARKGMENSETPGHLFWYAEHREDEQKVPKALGLPDPLPKKKV